MAARIYVLTGPPGSGKSKLIELIRNGEVVDFCPEIFVQVPGSSEVKVGTGGGSRRFQPTIVTKSTTRRRRLDEGPEIESVTWITTVAVRRTPEAIRFVNEFSKYYTWDNDRACLALEGPLTPDLEQKLLQAVGGDETDKKTIQDLCKRAKILESEIPDLTWENTACVRRTKQTLLLVQQMPAALSWDRSREVLCLSGPMLFEEYKDLIKAIDDNPHDKYALQRLYQESNVLDPGCDVVYEHYTRRYGFRISNIVSEVASNKHVVIIVNEIRAIRELRNLFGPLVVPIFVYRSARIDTAALMESRGSTDEREVDRRKRKAAVILRRYMENIELYSHVILNTTDDASDLCAQMKGIVRGSQESDSARYIVREGLYE